MMSPPSGRRRGRRRRVGPGGSNNTSSWRRAPLSCCLFGGGAFGFHRRTAPWVASRQAIVMMLVGDLPRYLWPWRSCCFDKKSLLFASAREREVLADGSLKVLNEHLHNWSAPHALDRERIYVPVEPSWRIGLGQRVAIVDTGLPKRDAFLWCSTFTGGDGVSRRPKVYLEIDTTAPGAPKAHTKSKYVNCSKSDTAASLFRAQRPYISNHLTRSIAYGYLEPPPPREQKSGMADATAAEIISVVFRKALYVHTSKSHAVRASIDAEQAEEYVAQLARATTFLAKRGQKLKVTSVQVSAVDGTGASPQFYRDTFRSSYAEWERNVKELRALGLWLSAPTGNQRVKNESAGFNWPASDPDVVGVGCFSNLTGHPVRQRGTGMDIATRTLDSLPFSSYCNTLAVATAVLVRDVCDRRCDYSANNAGSDEDSDEDSDETPGSLFKKVADTTGEDDKEAGDSDSSEDEAAEAPPENKNRWNLRRCSADFVLYAMQRTAEVISDQPFSRDRHYVLTPHRLYAYLDSPGFCDDLRRFHDDRDFRDQALDALPWRSTYFQRRRDDALRHGGYERPALAADATPRR